MQPIHDERRHRLVCLRQPIGEEFRFRHRIPSWGCHEHEGRSGIGQQGLDAPCPLPETLLHAIEGPEECHRVLDDLRPGNL